MGELDAGVKTFSRVFSLSFSGKKIAIQILGLLCACIASLIILGIGGAIFRDRLQTLVDVFNWVVVVFILFITWGAVAKITVAEVAELAPVGIKAAIGAARKSAKALIIAPLKIVAIIIILGIIHFIAGWIGLIPFVGEIVWPFFAIPLFLLSALIVIAFLILLCGTLLLPAIIMVGKESPVSELNDFLRENTLRFIGYLVAAVVIVMIVFTFLNFVVGTNAWLSAKAMGDKYATIVASVPTKISDAMSRIGFFFQAPFARYGSYRDLFAGRMPTAIAERMLSPGTGISTSHLRWTYSFAGFVWGIFTFIIYLAILSLPFVIWCVSGTLIYLGLKPTAVSQGPAPEEKKE
jgi:hypothetical protein